MTSAAMKYCQCAQSAKILIGCSALRAFVAVVVVDDDDDEAFVLIHLHFYFCFS